MKNQTIRKNQRLRRNQNLKRLNSFFILTLFLFIFVAYNSNVYAESGLVSDIISLKKSFVDLMNRWVSFRWGLNCVIYVLYYDPSILEPWVELNAKLNGWNEIEKEEFRKGIESALKVGKNTAFLLTIENLGKEPVTISPLSERVFLEDSNGRKYRVSSYEAHLDFPITGKVQGLIFFPLIPKDVNKIILRISGLPDGEVLLAWNLESQLHKAVEGKKELSWEQVLASKESDPKSKVETQKVEVKVVKPEGQVKSNIKPAPSEPPKVKTPPSPPKQGEGKKSEEKPKLDTSSEVKTDLGGAQLEEIKVEKVEETDPLEILKMYLEAWKLKDYEKMYSLLSSESRNKFSLSQFKDLVEEKMPNWLRSGDYKVLQSKKKEREASISLVSTLKLGFIRILETYTFNLLLDREGWRIKF
ncbi:MAG: hypothetical protein NZ900_07880 [Synergistetes bacterium]|nr:hypothetical protein [Synergistota bacterium]MDW8192839.1 hypothetical protein [Synergistota bacterium]